MRDTGKKLEGRQVGSGGAGSQDVRVPGPGCDKEESGLQTSAQSHAALCVTRLLGGMKASRAFAKSAFSSVK